MPSCKTWELSTQVNSAAFVQLAGAPFLSRIHRNWKFQHLFLGRLSDVSIPDDQEPSWRKVCGGGRGDRRPSAHQIQALACMVLTLPLTRFYPSSRYKNKAL